MKRIALVLLLTLSALPGRAATSPFDQWEKEIAAFETADKTSTAPTNAVLFIGSSNIRMWKTLHEDFAAWPVIQRGFGGCQLTDVAHFADRIALPYRPRLIVVSAGVNDIHAGKTPESVFAAFTQFVGTVRAALPETRIAFMSISPSPSRWHEADAQKKANAMIREFTEAGKNMDYINTYDALLGPDGKPRPELFIEDMQHHSAAGYKVRTDVTRPHLPE